MTDALLGIVEQSNYRDCFNNVYIMDAGVAKADDVYGEGTLAQFYGVWRADALMRRTNYMLWMEPGTMNISFYVDSIETTFFF